MGRPARRGLERPDEVVGRQPSLVRQAPYGQRLREVAVDIASKVLLVRSRMCVAEHPTAISPARSVRSASGSHRRFRGPVYSDCGRMMRLARFCSIAWAIHPLTRLIAKVGVNSGTSRPRPCRSSAV